MTTNEASPLGSECNAELGPLPEPDMSHEKARDDREEETSYSAEAMEAERQRCYALGVAEERERWHGQHTDSLLAVIAAQDSELTQLRAERERWRQTLDRVTEALAARLGTHSDEWRDVATARKLVGA